MGGRKDISMRVNMRLCIAQSICHPFRKSFLLLLCIRFGFQRRAAVDSTQRLVYSIGRRE